VLPLGECTRSKRLTCLLVGGAVAVHAVCEFALILACAHCLPGGLASKMGRVQFDVAPSPMLTPSWKSARSGPALQQPVT
jgi:hypothetical protein